MKLYLNLPHFVFMYMVIFALWNFIWTFCVLSSYTWSPSPYKVYIKLWHFLFMYIVSFTWWNLIWSFYFSSSCEWSSLPHETIYKPSAFCLNVYGHLYPMKHFMNLRQFIFLYMVSFTLWNFMWTFHSLSSSVWSPLPSGTVYEPSKFYLDVYGHGYHMELYMNLLQFFFMYMVTFTLWNFW